MDALLDAFGIKDGIDKMFSDSFNLYMHTITLALVSHRQENPKEFALAIIEGWKLSFAGEKEDFLEGKESITKEIYGRGFDGSLEKFTQTMKEAIKSSFPEKPQDIETFFQPIKPKEDDSTNPAGSEGSDTSQV
jgi:hypothetical protein